MRCPSKLTALLPILLLIALDTVSAEVIWDGGDEVTLNLGDKYNFDSYAIEAADFDRESVLLTIYKHDKIIDSLVLKTGEDFVYNDEIKINETEVFSGAKSFAKLNLWKNAVPDFTISFETETDTYSPGSYIPVTINIKNDANVTAKNITVILDPDELDVVTGQTMKHYDSINANTQVSFSVTVTSLRSPKKSTFTLIAMASGYGENNINYKGYGSKSLTILSSIYIEKTVEGKKIDDVPYIYWGTPSNVTIEVINCGNSEVKAIKMDDSITDDFESTSLSFPSFDLPEGNRKILNYIIIPKKPGRYTLPKANASFTLNGEKVKLESEEQELIVGGAYVQLAKTYEIVDEKGLVQVMMTAQNIGDVPAKTAISETISDNVKILGSASLNRTVTLDPGEKEIISYLALIPTKVDLPPATAEYNNLTIESNEISIFLPESNPVQIEDEIKDDENETNMEGPDELSDLPSYSHLMLLLLGMSAAVSVRNHLHGASRSLPLDLVLISSGIAVLAAALIRAQSDMAAAGIIIMGTGIGAAVVKRSDSSVGAVLSKDSHIHDFAGMLVVFFSAGILLTNVPEWSFMVVVGTLVGYYAALNLCKGGLN